VTVPWIVLKYGGTSVSTAERWASIARRAKELLPTHRVWIVASAVAEVSDRLEAAIEEAIHGLPPGAYGWIRDCHRALAEDLEVGDEAFRPVARLLEELRYLLEGIRLTREASPRLRARVMAFGELLSTKLGIAALARHGVEARWLDARELLVSRPRPAEPEAARYLDAEVEAAAAPEQGEAASAGSRVVLTQGFIARTPRGETCLLGRGGSDTSASLFAVLLGAEAVEIWTDVPGLFTTDPREIPSARLIRRIGYREAQELAAMGAKVLHPRCLGPASKARIPILLKSTADPHAEGTRIGEADSPTSSVMAVVRRSGVTLVTLSTLEMWGSSGFLARAFAPLAELGLSVDLVATSQSAVSFTLDRIPGGVEGDPFAAALERLRSLGQVQVVHPCAVVSIVGRRIRAVLHELGPALSVFREHNVYLVSESSEDLNLSFVVDEEDARPLVADLHARLFPIGGGDSRFGPTWEMLEAAGAAPRAPTRGEAAVSWWRRRRGELLELSRDGKARYVYDLAVVADRARRLRERLPSVDAFYYSMKANPHPRILATVAGEGFGIECVSAGELSRAREVVGESTPLLFTPNFCPIEEYRFAFEIGAEVTVDAVELLEAEPDVFRGREIAVRFDPGWGAGHHEKVRTGGAQAKFGVPLAEAASVRDAAERAGARIVGLHAHVGSGIFDPSAWARTGEALASVRPCFPDVRWLDLGGGLGVPERPGQEGLDLEALEKSLAAFRAGVEGISIRLEPGRYVVSEAGVLLAPVTQVRLKGGVRFAGVATGMNSLLRPALYGAWHPIHNLTRLEERPSGSWQIVGPVCESGDILGRDRLLPETRPGDILLVENCGAYAAAMASRYNLRDPAEEWVLDG